MGSECTDSEDELDTYKANYVEEDANINLFCDLVLESIDGLEMMVFSTTDLKSLKEKEKTLCEKEEIKYFRSKLNSPILCSQITAAMAPYLAPKQLKMLMCNWSTQLNEAINNSVVAYDPMIKNLSGTLLLKTRVGIASRVFAIGYFSF